ncbi:aconitate hydratase AcnA [Cupriavidus sp. H39]|uniref:aconitate hydratase AcnA n=1 Tax=Cupriavidus sp. H39 TaxID=3401635 RepID=UPI003D04A94B
MSVREAALKALDSIEATVPAQPGLHFYSIAATTSGGADAIARLPFCLRALAENVLRHIGTNDVEEADLRHLLAWRPELEDVIAVPFHPARVLMQDYTGIPALVDLAALRDAIVAQGQAATRINPRIPVDLVIDHSLIVDQAGHAGALTYNLGREFERNTERYRLAKWATATLSKVRVVPPGNGIVHQINLERIASIVCTQEEGAHVVVFPDTMVGTDSHSTMVNGIGVLGWGVGGIEAEAAMLGLPITVPLRRIVGVRLSGSLRAGVTATDLVLTLTQQLRAFNVVDALVEFFGPALDTLAVTDRATIANMAPEYGSTAAFFPIDAATLRYLTASGRDAAHVALVEAYAKAQGLWRAHDARDPEYSSMLDFDLSDVAPCVAGPKRPQDRVELDAICDSFRAAFSSGAPARDRLSDGAVIIAAITSCTNTSNPAVMIAAGLLARNARARGLKPRPWIKTSLTPGSRVVGAYLEASGLQADLDALGFQVAGYGCATCGGNSGQLDEAVENQIHREDIIATAVLSGNRNFEARIHPMARANYLMSPPLVIAYALAGNIQIDLTRDPLCDGSDGRPVYLREIWPDDAAVQAVLENVLTPTLFETQYRNILDGSPEWRALDAPSGVVFPWDASSTYIRRPPFLDHFDTSPVAQTGDIVDARILLMLGDSTTTDHISPVGSIPAESPAGLYLRERGVKPVDFNAYGSRRANHEVMVRGTFANIRLSNELVPGVLGGQTKCFPEGEVMPIYDAAMRYAARGVSLVIVAGREYGTGSSRDWAAKGTSLLGVRVVIAESFERIHRSNLIMMGVLPLEFPSDVTRKTLGLAGTETLRIESLDQQARPGGAVRATLRRADGSSEALELNCRIDTANELKVWRAGGMMRLVLGQLSEASTAIPRSRH